MALHLYGVLKGKAIEVRLGAGQSPHYQVRLVDDDTDYRIAVNVRSQLPPSDVDTLVAEHYDHPIQQRSSACPLALRASRANPERVHWTTSAAISSIARRCGRCRNHVPGFDNDLNEKIDRVMQRAVADEAAVVYAFGERWGPEPRTKDKYFGFLPGNGIHDIHMNQGNSTGSSAMTAVPGRRPARPLPGPAASGLPWS